MRKVVYGGQSKERVALTGFTQSPAKKIIQNGRYFSNMGSDQLTTSFITAILSGLSVRSCLGDSPIGSTSAQADFCCWVSYCVDNGK